MQSISTSEFAAISAAREWYCTRRIVAEFSGVDFVHRGEFSHGRAGGVELFEIAGRPADDAREKERVAE